MTTVRLQGIGHCESIKASELRIGMVAYFNYGHSYKVTAIEANKSGKTLTVGLESRNGSDAGKVYSHRYNVNSNVVAGFVK